MISGKPGPQGAADARWTTGRDLVVFAILAVLVIALEAGGDTIRLLLRFDRTGLQAGEYWRLVTGHLVHLGWGHALLNLAALGLIMGAFRPLVGWGSWGIAAIAAVISIDIGLWISSPPVGWYVGLSGVLHGLVVAAAVELLATSPRTGSVILAAVAAKLAWETLRGPLPFTADLSGGDVIEAAHLWGAVGGGLAAVVILGLRKPAAPL